VLELSSRRLASTAAVLLNASLSALHVLGGTIVTLAGNAVFRCMSVHPFTEF
jgi:hypothetical protein